MGDCYEAAVNFMMKKYTSFFGPRKGSMPGMRDFMLVHGVAIGDGGDIEGMEFGHAWIEMSGGIIRDTSNGRQIAMKRRAYYAKGKIDPKRVKRYTWPEVKNWLRKTKHYGPWEVKSER